MAQVWLSFEEIQKVFSCEAADARRRVIANQWERRRCSDGLVRVEVPPEVARDYFTLHYANEQEAKPAPLNEFEAAMEALCRIFGEEAGPTPAASVGDEDLRPPQPVNSNDRFAFSRTPHSSTARRANFAEAEHLEVQRRYLARA